MNRKLACSVVMTAAACLATPAFAEPAEPLTEEKAGEVRGACGYPNTGILDATAVASVDELARRLPNRGTPQIVYGARLPDADMRPHASVLERTCFHSSTFERSNWDGVSVTGLTFVRSNLSGAKMRGANLNAARFVGVNLSGADMSGASLRGGQWIGAHWESSLAGTRFTGAQLESFVFTCSIVMSESCGTEATQFTGANFRGADLSQLPVYGGDDFRGAQFDLTVIDLRALAHLDKSVQFSGPVYVYKGADIDPVQREVAEFSSEDIAEIRRHIVSPETRDRASFACAKARSRVEKLVCGEWAHELREADRLLAKAYTEALARGITTAAEQQRWLAQRDRCEDTQCIETAYAARSDKLLGRLGPGDTMTPGSTRTFVEPALELAPAFRQTALYRRMAQPLRVSAFQNATLRMHGDGSISASGEAIGGNAHMCSFGVDRARFDPATGWYSAQAAGGQMVPLFRLVGDRLVFRYSGNSGDTPDEAMDYLSCGARVGFSPMVALLP